MTMNGTRHELKIHPEYFEAVLNGAKKFEYRLDDRGYKVGDTLFLMEYDPGKCEYTKRYIERVVTYILPVKDNYVVMSIDVSEGAIYRMKLSAELEEMGFCEESDER